MAKADCTELDLLINDMAMNLGSRKETGGLEGVIAGIQAMPGLEALTRENIITAISEATASAKRNRTEGDKLLSDLRKDVRKEVETVAAIDVLRQHVESATQPSKKAKPEPKPTPDALLALQAEKAGLEGQISGDIPASLGKVANDLAKIFVAEGVTDRNDLVDAVHAELVEAIPDLTKRQTADAISGFGQFRQLSKDEISVTLRDLKGQLQQVSKLEDMAMGQAPLKTGVERRDPSDEERRLIQEVNEAKRKGGFTVTDPATQLKTALGAIKTRLRNQISDLEKQIKTRQKIVKVRSATPRDAETADMEKRRDDLKRQFDEIFKPPGLSDQQRIANAKRAVEKSITEFERRLAEGDFSPRAKSQTPETPELKALREKRDMLRKQYDIANPETPQIRKARERLSELERHLAEGTLPPARLRGATKSPVLSELQKKTAALRKAISQSDPSIKRKYEKGIAEYTRRLEENDYMPKVRPSDVVRSNELERKKFELDRLRKEINQRVADHSPKGTFDVLLTPFHAARSLMTAFDVSAIGRQGLFIGLANPVRAAKIIPTMFKAMFSEQAAWKAHQSIIARKNAPQYARAKLHISELDGALSDREEAFMSRIVENIPLGIGKGVRGSSRAYITYLNLLRADSFDAMAGGLARNGEVTQKEAEAIANYINVASGRGNLGKGALARSADGLSILFFAPRLVTSRFQMALLQPLRPKLVFSGKGIKYLIPKVVGSGSARVRKEIAKEYGKFMIGLGTVAALGVLAGGDLELDPRSSNFGKLRFGNTRMDIMGGLGQVVTLMSRVASGSTKTAKGKVKKIRGKVAQEKYGGDTSGSIVGRFMRTKFSPFFGTGWDAWEGTSVVGELTDPRYREGTWQLASGLMAPLSFWDVKEAIQAEGVPKGTALGLASLFGLGLSTYDEGEKWKNPYKGATPWIPR